MSREVLIIDTGLANVRSVEVAFARLGAATRRVTAPQDLARAERVVLPGVGAFAPGLASLEARGLAASLRQRALAGRPLLAVCLGLQLLCEGSDEDPGGRGLGVIPARARRLPAPARVPHMGWCAVANGTAAPLGHAYFAHSFAVPGADLDRLRAARWQLLVADHGGPFLAAARKGGVLACQFHPELSGRWGAALLRAWLEDADQEVAPWPR
ncbi:MAG: imidazole glycerol phosphate synthase subunit HisH [Candidatus Krumholzibacteriia bacterium]